MSLQTLDLLCPRARAIISAYFRRRSAVKELANYSLRYDVQKHFSPKNWTNLQYSVADIYFKFHMVPLPRHGLFSLQQKTV